MNLYGRIRRILSFTTRADLLNLALQRAARLRGQLETARFLCEWYADAAGTINPHEDWWEFARLKQRHVDACRECAELSKLYAQAMNELKALEEA